MPEETPTPDPAPDEVAPVLAPVYPDGTVGVLMRQRDELGGNAEAARSMAASFTSRAEALDAQIAQLTATIVALTPQDPTA